MCGDARVPRIIAERASPKGSRPGEDFGGDDGKLVRGVESVDLGVGVVVDRVEAELDKTGVT